MLSLQAENVNWTESKLKPLRKKLHEELVMQNLRREPHSSVTVRLFRNQKSCCHVIAAPTLTVMQGFEAKKKIALCISFPVSAYCVAHSQP